MTTPRHPAKWSQSVLDAIGGLVAAEGSRLGRAVKVLDPYAGVGIARLAEVCGEWAAQVVGVEIEPDWGAADPRIVVGDATTLPSSWSSSFDVAASSCTYGNRYADSHDAKDACKRCDGAGETGPGVPCRNCKGAGLSRRNTYKHAIGHDLHPKNTGQMQWGSQYRAEHQLAMRELLRVLRPGGLVLWNCSNHIRDGEEQLVAEWHLTEWLNLGCKIVKVARISTQRNRQGANHGLRVDGELLLVLRTPTETRLL